LEYTDRLNSVVNPSNWFETVNVVPASGFDKITTRKTLLKEGDPDYNAELNKGKSYKAKQYKEETVIAPGAQLFVTVGAGIMGIGYHEDVGQEPADSDLAITAAYAQALKRACYHFGLGRYFYDMPKIWHPIDRTTKAFREPGPVIPDMFLPRYFCQETGNLIEAVELKGVHYTISQLVANSKKKFGGVFCIEVQRRKAQEIKEAAGNPVKAA